MMLQASPPSQFLDAFQAVRGQWFAAVQGAANTLFWRLAAIEFAWSGAELALERTTTEAWVAGLLKKIMFIGAFLTLLTFGSTWIPWIISSFTQIGQQASGVGALEPGAIFDLGLNLLGTLLNGSSQAGFFSHFPTAIAMVLAAAGTFVCFTLICIQLIAALVESYIAVALGFIFLGFGGSRWTAPYVEKYIALAIGIGVKIMVLYALIGVGMTLSGTWLLAAQQVSTSVQPVVNAFGIFGQSLIFVAICWFVPKFVAGILGGAPAFTGGEILAVASTAAYAAVQAGRMAVSLVPSGGGGAAGGTGASGTAGVGSTGGGATAMASPGGSSGGGAQPGPPVAAAVGSNGGSNGAGHQVPPPATGSKGD